MISNAIIKETARKEFNAVLNTVGLSRIRIEQRFLNATGLTMSSFNGKMRFQKSVLLLKNNTPQASLTQIAYDEGDFDQSHIISEFKKYTALTPFSFVKQKTAMKDFISSLASPEP